MSRILGIDCGSAATGYGIIDSDGRHSSLVAAEVIRPGRRDAFASRLQQIAQALRHLIHMYEPQVMAVEGVFHSVNARSALQLGHVRGVALLSAAESNLPVHEYSALEIKASVVGYGRAEKSQVQQMVVLLLRLDQTPSEDAADALAVALCHAHHSTTLGRLERSAATIAAHPPRTPFAPA